jgi:hypothetical protein
VGVEVTEVTVGLGVLVGMLVGVEVGVLVGMLVGVAVGGVPVTVGVGLVWLASTPQKPPYTANWPPESDPASGWPIVAPSEYAPPVLNVPPPPSIVYHDRSKLPPTWAYATPTLRAIMNVATSNPIRRGSLDLFISFSYAAHPLCCTWPYG